MKQTKKEEQLPLEMQDSHYTIRTDKKTWLKYKKHCEENGYFLGGRIIYLIRKDMGETK